MTAEGKIRITITAAYQDGDYLCVDREFIAEALLRAFEKSEFSLLELRIIAPRGEAEELLRGMVCGKAELLIDSIKPAISN
jgi:hypothetical protein